MIVRIASSCSNSWLVSGVTSEISPSTIPCRSPRWELEAIVALGLEISELVLLDQFTVVSFIESFSTSKVSSHDIVKIFLSNPFKFLFFCHLGPWSLLGQVSGMLIIAYSVILLMICKLLSKSTYRICNLSKSNLFTVLNTNLWEQIFCILLFDPFWWKIIHFLDFTTPQFLPFVWDLFLCNTLNLIFKVFFLEILELFLVVWYVILKRCWHCISPCLTTLNRSWCRWR